MSFSSLSFESAMSASTSSSQQTKTAAIVFLHGLGSTSSGLSTSLPAKLSRIAPRLKEVCHFVFPDATTIPIYINGGMRMPGWFDLYDWPIAVGSKEDSEGMARSLQQLQDIVQDLKTTHGLSRQHIIIGGFSQGGAVALQAAYNNIKNSEEPPFVACLALSAWWTPPQGPTITPPPATPLFWAHGTYDDKVLPEQQMHGVRVLEAAGLDTTHIETHQYPMGHEFSTDEIKALATFLERVLGLDSEATKKDSELYYS